nr:hypothetical protein [Ferrimicrobium sp.]
MCSFGIDLDRSIDSPELIGDMDIAVPKRCSRDRSSDASFLDQPLGDLVGEITRVELSDRAHDSMHEHARWGLIDVFAGAYQRDASLFEGKVD